MAIKNFLCGLKSNFKEVLLGKGRKSLFVFLIGFSFFVFSCSSIKTRRDIEREGSHPEKQESQFGEEKRDSSDEGPWADQEVKESESEGQAWQQVPEPKVKAPKVGLILGPGGVRSFAHASFIGELEKRKVPIDAIVGLEWGALVAALYSQKGQVHDMEWQLYKLSKEDLGQSSFFSSKVEAVKVSKIVDFLKNNFGSNQIQKAKVDFACPVARVASERVDLVDRGEFVSVLQNCVSYPPLFSFEPKGIAAPMSIRDSVAHLKERGMDIIIFVNAITQGELIDASQAEDNYASAVLWSEIRRQLRGRHSGIDEYVSLDISKASILDFDRQKELQKSSQSASRRAAERIAEKYGF